MTESIEVDICVIGAGAAGLSVAAGASQMGARVALFEKGAMGGDCLNVGCVPSKALLSAGHVAHLARDGARFGVDTQVSGIDWGRVTAHVKRAITTIEPVDSQERYEGFGVRVIREHARFTGPREVSSDSVRVTAKYVVLATGSRPAVPPIPGLDGVPYLTNEGIFETTERPDHLIVLGGGPIGAELAQAHARLGSKVTLIEAATLMGNDDPEAVDVVRTSLLDDGIDLREGAKAVKVSGAAGAITVEVEGADGPDSITGSHLLVAVGRKVSFDGLDVDKAGIELDERGRLKLDARLRTTNKRVFASGDAAGGPQFTHVAGGHAGTLIKNMLFWLPSKAETGNIPRVTYTAPELAHIGPTEAELADRGAAFQVLRWAYAENDRAIAEADMAGFAKVLVDPKGRILAATMVGTGAGESLAVWVLAISKKLKVADIAPIIIPYPTRTEVAKRAAGSWFTPKLFSERTRRIVRFLMRFS